MSPRRVRILRRTSIALAAVLLAVVLVKVGHHFATHTDAGTARTAVGAVAPTPAPAPTGSNAGPLVRAIRLHRPVVVVGIGSSVGDGATLPDPSTQSPVAHLGLLLQARFPHSVIRVHNLSVAGSTAFDGVQLYSKMVRSLHPTVLFIAYGMNDGEPAQFNSGETLPGSMASMRTIVAEARASGTTVMIATTPSPDTERDDFAFPAGLPIQYPTPGGPLVPSVADRVTTIDGEPFSARHAIWNSEARALAQAERVTLVDAARYWPAAIARYGQSGLFDAGHGPLHPPQFVHPNLRGHEVSYWTAEDQVVDSLVNTVASDADR